jgi:hypothetical protein
MSQNVFGFAFVAHDPLETDGGGIPAANPRDELRFIRRAMARSTMSDRA